jgi:hypothetical protein
MGENSSRLSAKSSATIDLAPADLEGILHFLRYVQTSLKTCYGDNICSRLLGECLSNLSDRFGILIEDLDSEQNSSRDSLVALQRMLRYVQRDIAESLKDDQSLDLLAQCIDHLAQMQPPRRDQCCAQPTQSSH